MPHDHLHGIITQLPSAKDVVTLSATGKITQKAAWTAECDVEIGNVRRHCSVLNNGIFPTLRLTQIPTQLCADSVIALSKHSSIKTLFMDKVKIESRAFNAIAETVEKPKSLISLWRCAFLAKLC